MREPRVDCYSVNSGKQMVEMTSARTIVQDNRSGRRQLLVENQLPQQSEFLFIQQERPDRVQHFLALNRPILSRF